MKIKEIQDKQAWNQLVLATAPHAFFQSWEWGEVEKKNGHKVARWGMYDGNSLIGGAQTIEVHAKRGDYLHVRHGPILREWNEHYIRGLINFLREEANKRGLLFIRVSPLIKAQQAGPLQVIGFKEAPIHNMDAQVNYVVDVCRSLDEVLMDMRKTTRQIVRKVSKDNEIKVKAGAEQALINDFLSLYKNTATHKHFVEWQGIRHEIQEFSGSSEAGAECILACFERKPVAGAVINYWGNQGIYHYAAATREGLRMGAAYKVVWEAIKKTKERGLFFFNLWGGIADISDNTHPWHGLTVFKRGFGAKKREFIPALDLPLSGRYRKTYILETLIKYIRGYEKIGGFRVPTFLRSLFSV